MKTFVVFTFLIVAILHNLIAEIKNGYEKDIQKTRISLQALQALLSGNEDLSAGERRKMKAKMRSLMEYLAYHEVTFTLLAKFKAISPDLYHEIDTLKDSKGRSVDVYVKFLAIEKAKVQIPGMVSFYSSAEDRNSCMSEYGQRSVSVLVWISSSSLSILSHEFGHLRYIVPNLSSYMSFYKNVHASSCQGGSFGHTAGDLSGVNAIRFEKRFRASYARYRKVDSSEFVSPLTLLVKCRRNIFESQNSPLPAPAVREWALSYETHDRRLP